METVSNVASACFAPAGRLWAPAGAWRAWEPGKPARWRTLLSWLRPSHPGGQGPRIAHAPAWRPQLSLSSCRKHTDNADREAASEHLADLRCGPLIWHLCPGACGPPSASDMDADDALRDIGGGAMVAAPASFSAPGITHRFSCCMQRFQVTSRSLLEVFCMCKWTCLWPSRQAHLLIVIKLVLLAQLGLYGTLPLQCAREPYRLDSIGPRSLLHAPVVTSTIQGC